MPTIRIDDEVMEYLKRKAEPFVDTPNDVLRREFRLDSSSSSRSAQGSRGETLRLVSDHPEYLLRTTKMNGALKGLTAKAAEERYRGQENRNHRQALLEELREVFGCDGQRNSGAVHSVEKRRKYTTFVQGGLTEAEFRVPILQALAELGGQGYSEDILQRAYNSVKHRLDRMDLEEVRSGGPRWKKKAQWQKYEMTIEDPPLVAGLRRGEWVLTEEGRRVLENANEKVRQG